MIIPFARFGMFLPRISSLPISRGLCTNRGVHDLTDIVEELNKEMKMVFGQPPPTPVDMDSSICSHDPPLKSSSKLDNNCTKLSHLDKKGEVKMIDVSMKEITERVASASCKVMVGKKVFDLVSENQFAKGDVLTVAKIAGINGAKHTSSLIPLSHNIGLTCVSVDMRLNEGDFSVEIEGRVSSVGKTGVEMEAMTAVTVAALTVYDMCKSASRDIYISHVQLQHKSGGKGGDWTR